MAAQAALLIVPALFLGYIASIALKDAGKEMGTTVGGTFVLGLLVSATAHALPRPRLEVTHSPRRLSPQ